MTTNKLRNLRVVLARADRQVSVLKADLERRGAEVIALPAMQIEEVEGWHATVFSKTPPAWTIVSNKSTAERIARAVRQGQGRHEDLGRIAAIGQSAAQYLEKHGLWPQRSSDTHDIDSLMEGLIERGVKGETIQILGPESLAIERFASLADAGAILRPEPVYRVKFFEGSADVFAEVGTALPDLVVFPSLSTVTHYYALLEECDAQSWSEIPAAVIGPTTAQAASEYGFRVSVVPEIQTMDELASAIERWHMVH